HLEDEIALSHSPRYAGGKGAEGPILDLYGATQASDFGGRLDHAQAPEKTGRIDQLKMRQLSSQGIQFARTGGGHSSQVYSYPARSHARALKDLPDHSRPLVQWRDDRPDVVDVGFRCVGVRGEPEPG